MAKGESSEGKSEGTLDNTVESAYDTQAEVKGGDGAYLMPGGNPTEVTQESYLPQTAYKGSDGPSLMSGVSPDYLAGVMDAIKAMMGGLNGGNIGGYMPMGGMSQYGSQLDIMGMEYGTQPMTGYSPDSAEDAYQGATEGTTYEGSSDSDS